MSDAITLDVLSSSPVQLDVGDADPIAREEIAALATRVTTAEGDISALDGRMDTAEGDISTLGTTVDGIDARVEAIEADYMTAEDVMGALGGEAPALVAGSSRAVLGDAETASWMERTTAADGAALIESVKGNTLRWNQLVSRPYYSESTATLQGVSFSVADGYVTAEGTASAGGSWTFVYNANVPIVAGHKMLVSGIDAISDVSFRVYSSDTNMTHISNITAAPQIFTIGTTSTKLSVYLLFSANQVVSFKGKPQLFDLTQMFGAGNEPATVAEFEALFPDSYYPYDAGSLLPVRIEGIETVGFNQWDEEWELGWVDNTGANRGSSSNIRSKNYIPVFPNTQYYLKTPQVSVLVYFDADKNCLGNVDANGLRDIPVPGAVRTTPSNCRYVRFWLTSGTAYNHDICINISDPARNGNYEPYWTSQRAIPAATYFPQGMRSAGTVRDELRADAAITRVGERAYQSGDESDTSVITDGTVTHYALATPTTTPIDPPLPMSYRVGAGGTERVMLASGTTSAPPVFVTRYPVNLAALAESIAPRESATAEANHAVGDLIMLGWTLCKVTTAIARGEAITIGTNVTRTSVAAEIAALS